MEASKVVTNEHITRDTKHFSIKNIVNIRYDLGVLDALMELNKSPLCKTIYSPQTNDFLLQTDENIAIHYEEIHALSSKQLEILSTIYRRIVHSLDKKIPTIQLIEGGSGTGKTTLVWSLTMQCLMDQQDKRIKRNRILVCAVDNRCIDLIASKLLDFSPKIGKFGNFFFYCKNS